MPEDKVAIIKKDGTFVYYNTYGAARAASNPNSGDHDLIQIRANLNEEIHLKDGVDIWIMPGIVVDYNPSPPPSQPSATIADYTVACKCNIYGEGIIKSTFNSGTDKFNCIVTSNPNTELSIECDYIQGIGGPGDLGAGASIYIINANKFDLTCNKVYSTNSAAFSFGGPGSLGFVNDFIVNVKNIEIGAESDSDSLIPQAFGVMCFGNGLINIDEIKCNHHGHGILLRKGDMTALVKKITVINNKPKADATIVVGHGDINDHDQKLILYFDTIQALAKGSATSGPGIDLSEGTGIFIGRHVFSKDGPAIQIQGFDTKGFVKCNEIISDTINAMTLNDFTNQITIDANNIIGKGDGDIAVIFSYDTANYVIKNARIKNINSGSSVYGIKLIKNPNGGSPSVTFNNAIIIANGILISYNVSSPSLHTKNYGLFGNKDIAANIILDIGNLGNYVFVPS